MADEETPEQRERRLTLELTTREIADKIREMVPKDTTFMLFLSDVGEKGNIGYAGDAKRESLHRWGANQ